MTQRFRPHHVRRQLVRWLLLAWCGWVTFSLAALNYYLATAVFDGYADFAGWFVRCFVRPVLSCARRIV